MNTMTTVEIWDAGHDRNGNPRRAVVVSEGGHAMAATPMGYLSPAQTVVTYDRRAYTGADAETVSVSVSEYRRAVKFLSA